MNLPRVNDPRGIRFAMGWTGDMVFVRYPATVTPPEGFLGACGGVDWQTGGKFKDGQWCGVGGKPFKRGVTQRTAMEAPDA